MAKRSLGRVSTAELQRELSRREARLDSLINKRNGLASELAALNSEIEALGGDGGSMGSGGRRGPGRPKGSKNKSTSKSKKKGRGAHKSRGARTRANNSMTLVEALQKVLNGTTMGVTEVSEAVQRAGYKTNADNFRTIVNQTLIKNKKQFKKVSRGQYTAA